MINNNNGILEFGIKRENEERRDGAAAVVFDPHTKTFAVYKIPNDGHLGLFGGGVDDGEEIIDGIIREVIEESGLHDFSQIEELGKFIAHYYHSRKKLNRVTHSTFFLLILNSRNLVDTKHEEHEKFDLVFADLNEIIFNLTSRNQDKDYDHWIYFLNMAEKRLKELKYL